MLHQIGINKGILNIKSDTMTKPVQCKDKSGKDFKKCMKENKVVIDLHKTIDKHLTNKNLRNKLSVKQLQALKKARDELKTVPYRWMS